MLGDRTNNNEEFSRLADMGELRVERMRGIIADERGMWSGMVHAIHQHAGETSDQDAEIGVGPLTDEQAGRLRASMDRVSGYRLVELKELMATSADELASLLARKLYGGELEDVQYETVWAIGYSVMFYISGRPID